jgi:hypothetical protein
MATTLPICNLLLISYNRTNVNFDSYTCRKTEWRLHKNYWLASCGDTVALPDTLTKCTTRQLPSVQKQETLPNRSVIPEEINTENNKYSCKNCKRFELWQTVWETGLDMRRTCRRRLCSRSSWARRNQSQMTQWWGLPFNTRWHIH